MEMKFYHEDIKESFLSEFIKDFKAGLPIFNKLKKSIIHNDINDNNIIVSNDLLNPSVKSIIDFGDSVYTQTINDLAVTCSYGIMNVNDPLAACCEIISGYNNISSITDNELKLLYNLIAMRLVISVTKSLINRFKEPDNKYLLISEKPAWELLKKWVEVDSEFAYYSYRKACDLNAHPEQNNFYKWALENRFSVTDLFSSIKKNKLYKIDLSVGSKWIGGRNEIEDLENGKKVTYQIVGDDEADLKANKISISSPIARALIGKEEGDVATFSSPGGSREVEILNVKYI